MGKIKNRLVKRTGRELIEKGIGASDNFEENKKILRKDMPSKKIRNQIAGFLTQLKKQQIKKEAELTVEK